MVEGKFNMKNSKNIKYLVVCFLACFLLLGQECSPREFCPLPEGLDFEEIEPLSNNLQASIYFDASTSMAGFVNPGNSHYVRTLQMMERAFISGWPGCRQRNFYKFGIDISSVPRDKLKEAEFAGFYPDVKTHIEKVIDKIEKEKKEKDKLIIIISDLFQNQQDVNLLIEKLNEVILSEKMSVGILGIKSQFNGTVGDVGLITLNQELAFEYRTNGKKPTEYRPFYLLMFGKYSDIVHYYKMLKINGLDSLPEKNFVILSPQLVEKLASFENVHFSAAVKIIEVLNILQTFENQRHVKQFMVKKNAPTAYLDASIKLPILSNLMAIDPQKLDPKLTAWHWQKTPKKELIVCKEACRAIKMTNTKLSGSQLNFRIEIYPANFPRDGIYCFRIDIQTLADFFLLPSWVSAWDMDERLIDYWKQNPTQFKGNATLNLKNLFNNIWQIIYLKHKPKIARLYCYIKKE
jgi:hypothetical protein